MFFDYFRFISPCSFTTDIDEDEEDDEGDEDEEEEKEVVVETTLAVSLCKSTTQNIPPKFLANRTIGKENWGTTYPSKSSLTCRIHGLLRLSNVVFSPNKYIEICVIKKLISNQVVSNQIIWYYLSNIIQYSFIYLLLYYDV